MIDAKREEREWSFTRETLRSTYCELQAKGVVVSAPYLTSKLIRTGENKVTRMSYADISATLPQEPVAVRGGGEFRSLRS